MLNNGEKICRIYNPEDLLSKRQSLFAGRELLNFYRMPGVFMYSGVNELPTDLNQHARTDGTIYVNLDGEIYIYNIEDESVKVDENSLKKSYKYNKKLSDLNDGKVHSYIVTPLPLNKCCKVIFPSENVTFKPNLISMSSHYNGEEILNTLTDKILNHKCVLNSMEAIAIVMLPRMFLENQAEILEKACLLLKELKIDDVHFKEELILEMQCIIHKYAKTDEDIKRLEQVISVETIEEISKYPDNWHLDQFYYMGFYRGLEKGESTGFSKGLEKGESTGFSKGLEKGESTGFSKGLEKGKSSMILKFIDDLGIDEVVRISGLSRNTVKNYLNK